MQRLSRILAVSSIAIAFISTMSAQISTSTSQPEAARKGTAMAQYHDANFGFDYSYASALIHNPDMAARMTEAYQKSGGNVAKCITAPLTRMDTSQGMRVLALIDGDGECLGEPATAEQLSVSAQSLLQNALGPLGKAEIRSSVDYDVRGHSASTVFGSVPIQNQTLYAQGACILNGKAIICWMFLATDCQGLKEMVSFPVTFSGDASEAVVPARLAPNCSAKATGAN